MKALGTAQEERTSDHHLDTACLMISMTPASLTSIAEEDLLMTESWIAKFLVSPVPHIEAVGKLVLVSHYRRLLLAQCLDHGYRVRGRYSSHGEVV